MKITPVPGGWYGDSLPSGEYAFLVPTEKVIASEGALVAYPGDEPLWLVLTKVPLRKMMGQGHDTPFTYEWVEGRGWDTEPPPCGVWALIYDRDGEPHIAKCEPPTGSQGWRYCDLNNRLVLGDATQVSPQGIHEYTDLTEAQDGTTLVGQGQTGGVAVWAGGKLRQLAPGNCFNIRAKFDPWLDLVSVSFYEVARDGIEAWAFWGTWLEFQTLPEVGGGGVLQPDFHFLHPVMVVPFKDPNHQAGTAYRADDGSLGVYTEATDPSLVVAHAAAAGVRVLCGHDAPTIWVPPGVLRDWDIPLVELYRLPTETLEQSVARWHQQVDTLADSWPRLAGCVCGVIPMFYCQGGAPPDELWTVQEVLDGLAYLSEVVNSHPQVQVIAPFAYERANGISAHVELAEAFENLKRAASASGTVHLLPVEVPEPPHPIPPQPPLPPLPPTPFPRAIPLGVSMDPLLAAVKMGSYFARVDPTPDQAPWPGWFLVHFDQLDPSDPHCQFVITQPEAGNPKLRLVNRAIDGILSADAGIHGGGVCKQYYLKPNHDWGFNEQFSGWTLGKGPEPRIVLVEYPNGELSASVQVVAL